MAVGLVMGIVTLPTIDIFLPGGLVNAFNSRSVPTSAFHRLFVNKWLWGAVLLAAVLQFAVVEGPLLQQAFGTASLDAAHWAVRIGMASTVLWFDELLFNRSARRNHRWLTKTFP